MSGAEPHGKVMMESIGARVVKLGERSRLASGQPRCQFVHRASAAGLIARPASEVVLLAEVSKFAAEPEACATVDANRSLTLRAPSRFSFTPA